MGCEGYLSVKEITGGAHFLDEDSKLPWFRVTEPIAVLYEKASTLGGRINFSMQYNQWQDLFLPEKYLSLTTGQYTYHYLPNIEHPFILIGIVPQSVVMALYDKDKQRIDAGETISYFEQHLEIGAIPIPYHKTAWDKITPGFWTISDYQECGTYNDYASYHLYEERHPQLTFGKTVEWEIWT